MKKLTSVIIAACLAAFSIGCVTAKKTTVSSNGAGGFTTNTTVVVNEGNLLIDCTVLQGATAIAVNAVRVQTKNDPNVLNALKNAKIALDGVLMGQNQQTTAQVLQILKANGNPALEAQVTAIVQTVSQLEQNLLQKYGQSVAGEITIAILKSLDAGLAIGLSGA